MLAVGVETWDYIFTRIFGIHRESTHQNQEEVHGRFQQQYCQYIKNNSTNTCQKPARIRFLYCSKSKICNLCSSKKQLQQLSRSIKAIKSWREVECWVCLSCQADQSLFIIFQVEYNGPKNKILIRGALTPSVFNIKEHE